MIINIFNKLIKKVLLSLIGYDFFEKKTFLIGQKFAHTQKKIKKIRDLTDVEFSVFSQWGDDGIINWLTENIKIKNKIFIEIGTEDYTESNTRFLLKHRNWSGCLIEGNSQHSKSIKKQSIYWKHDLKIVNKFLNKDNINITISNLVKQKEIGLLSLDIDGIDYWIWEEIKVIKPIIFVCEFNSVFGDLHQITVPYTKNFERTLFHNSNLAFGASLNAFVKISKEKNYVFIGTNSSGINAYFINKKYYKYIKNKIKNIKSYPSKIRESRNKNYQKNFKGSFDRTKLIENVKLFDLKKKKLSKLKDYKKLYSKIWLQKFSGQ
tara:strand:- start:794 stop:1756 length:963 start_codon:yes stop_codon:yes gene_type:complete